MPFWALSLTMRAEILARAAHAKQIRKGSGVPYITHPQAVAKLLAGCSEVAQASAWLHDVVEDTSYTLDDIRKECGDEVASVVAELTEKKYDEDAKKRLWHLRKKEAIAAVLTLSQTATEVRAADVICNFVTVLEDLDRVGDAIWERFAVSRADSLWYYKSMMVALIPRMTRWDLRFQLQGALVACELEIEKGHTDGPK